MFSQEKNLYLLEGEEEHLILTPWEVEGALDGLTSSIDHETKIIEVWTDMRMSGQNISIEMLIDVPHECLLDRESI